LKVVILGNVCVKVICTRN